jgi:hypothetical protein
LSVDPGNAFEAGLTQDLLAEAQSNLCRRLRTDGRIDLCWSDLLSLLGRTRPSADFALPAVGVVLERLATQAPVRAAAYGLEAARAVRDGVVAQRLEAHLGAVLQKLHRWTSLAPPDDLMSVRGVLSEWRTRLPRLDVVGAILELIEIRLADGTPATGTSRGADARRA